MKNNTNTTMYLYNKHKYQLKTTPTTSTGDTTIATKKIPQTGTTEEILKIVIISITLVSRSIH